MGRVGAAVSVPPQSSLGIFLATVAGSMPQFGLLLMLVSGLAVMLMIAGEERLAHRSTR